MFNWLKKIFAARTKLRLGIDLGSSAIKIVETSYDKGKLKLETYGMAYFSTNHDPGREFSQRFYVEKPGDIEETLFRIGPVPDSALTILSGSEISQILTELLNKAQTKTRAAYFSLPAFTTFFTIIELPIMPENEIAAAVPYEAKKYIPVPLEDVVLDWSMIATAQTQTDQADPLPRLDEESENKNSVISSRATPVKILVVAIIKEAVEKYSQIAQMSGLEIKALEPENFSLMRALVSGEKDLFILVDIGSSFADITLIDKGFIRLVRSAKKIINPETKQLNKEILIANMEKILNLYKSKQKDKEFVVSKCILTGGGGLTPSLIESIKEKLGIEAIIGDPFKQIDYPQILDSTLKELGPSLAVAAGLAMRE